MVLKEKKITLDSRMLQTEMQIEFNAFLGYYDNIKVDKKRE